MRILLLRHCHRDHEDPTFASPLTVEGTICAESLIHSLPHFDYVYTSPFLRCLQTLAPVCWDRSKRARVDHGLYERVHLTDTAKKFDPTDFRHTAATAGESSVFSPIIDHTYESGKPLSEIQYGETPEDVERRADAFIARVKSVHAHEPHAVILVVTHLSVINAMRGLPDDAPLGMGECTGLRPPAE